MRYSMYLTLNHHLDHLASLREHCSRDPGAATSAGTDPRQRDDHALVGMIDQGASDTAPERRHFLRNPKWGPSDLGCKKSGDGHGLRRPTFVLRPSRRALRAAPGLPQGLDAVSHGLAFRLRRRSRAALRRNARPYGYAGVVALRSSLTLPRFPVLLLGPVVHLACARLAGVASVVAAS